MPLEKLTRARLVEALNLLGERAQQEKVELELCIYGGSAMILTYGSRDTTRNHLKINRPSASYLLAMKCLAFRSALPGYAGDIDDIKFLIRKMDIKSLDQIDDHIARFYPGEALASKSRAVLAEVLNQQGREAL